MLCLLTPTGARAEAFALLEGQMRRQDYAGAVLWIVVDDGPSPTPLGPLKEGWRRIVLRPEPFWSGTNTQGRNLRAGLDAAEAAGGKALRLLIIEDDDWYAPAWLAAADAALADADLVGEPFARYYNVRARRYAELGNRHHASLRASAMKGRALAAFRAVIAAPHPYYDVLLWRAFPGRMMETALTVGLKGLPGRGGIAGGHDMKGTNDPDLAVLKAWIGDDAAHYEQYKDERTMTGTIRLKALKAHRYGTRHLVAGEDYECAPGHVRLMVGLRNARVAEGEGSSPAAETPPGPPVTAEASLEAAAGEEAPVAAADEPSARPAPAARRRRGETQP